MKQQSKFSSEQTHSEAHQAQTPAGREFATADELLRFDAAQTTVPPRVGERLKQSAPAASPAKNNWFKRLFN